MIFLCVDRIVEILIDLLSFCVVMVGVSGFKKFNGCIIDGL